MSSERLEKSPRERMFTGVAGGLAEYWNVDPVLVRVGFVVVAIASGGLGALLYIVLAIVMPEGGRAEGEEEQRNDGSDGRTRDVLAIALIVIGAVLLLGNLGPWFEWRYVLPALLILIGAAMIIGRVRHS